MICNFLCRNDELFAFLSLLLELNLCVLLLLPCHCSGQENEKHRSSQVVNTLYVGTCWVTHCPGEENTDQHRLHLLAAEQLYFRLCAIYINFDLFEVERLVC